MNDSEKWMNLCDPNCQQKSMFPNCSLCDIALEYRTALAEGRLEAIPPADVRPVVMCGDCRWFNDRGYPNLDPEMPELRMGHCRILGRNVQACWFCGTGEKMGDDAL